MKMQFYRKLIPAALALCLALTGCNMGSIGSIGADGAVQVNGKDVTVSGTPEATNPAAYETVSGVEPDAAASDAAGSSAAQGSTEPAQVEQELAAQAEPEPEDPDLSGAVVFEEAQPEPAENGQVWGQEEEPENPFTQIEISRPEEPETPLGDLYAVFDEEPDDLEQILQDLPDRDAAEEIRSYFAAARQTADDADCTMTLQVRYFKAPVLSVLRTVTDGEGHRTLRSETFQTETAGLFTLADFFPGLEEDDWTGALLAEAEALLDGSDRELYSFADVDFGDGDLGELLTQFFDPDQFYLSSEGVTVYYQAGVLSDSSVQITVPYSRLTGFVMP
mgnify:CR=1 FL=1